MPVSCFPIDHFQKPAQTPVRHCLVTHFEHVLDMRALISRNKTIVLWSLETQTPLVLMLRMQVAVYLLSGVAALRLFHERLSSISTFICILP